MSKAKNQGFEISDGYNILMLRTEEGDYNEVLNILNGMKQIDINSLNKKGYTALALAVKNGFVEISELLISRGANVNIRNNSGQSPLFLSCWCNFPDTVKLLLQYGAEINTTDQRGWSPLAIAAYHGNMEIVETLLMANADVSIKDSFGKRAIHRAKDPKIIKTLQLAEVKLGLTSSISAEKGSRSTNIKTEPNLPMPSSDNKNDLTTSIAEIMDKRHESGQGHRRLGSPHLSYIASPTTKTPKTVRPPSWQASSKSKNTNLSFDGNSFDLKSPVKQSATPREGASGDIGRTVSPKYKAGSKQVRELELSLGSPLSAIGVRNKSESEEAFSAQMKQVSEKIYELIEEKVAFEVERQVQEYQAKLRKGIDAIVKTKISQSFNELQSAYNNHMKALLNKLGFGEDVISQAHFEIEEIIGQDFNTREDPMKFQSEKQRKANEVKIQRMERDIFGNSKSGPTKSNPIKNGFVSPVNNRIGAKNKGPEPMSKNVKATTESLLAHSKNKINEAVQNVGKTVHTNLLEVANSAADDMDQNSKTKMESMLNNKFSQLSEFMANGSLSDAESFEDSFQERKTSMDFRAKEESKGIDMEDMNRDEQVKLISPPKVEKIRIPEKRYSFFKEKNENLKEHLDAVKEEEESAKDPQTVQSLKDSRLTEKDSGQKVNVFENHIEEPQERVLPKTLPSKRDEDRSFGNITPSHSENSGALSSEFRLDGLKNYFGKKDLEGKMPKQPVSNRGSAPASIVNTNRSQQGGGATPIPGHSFGFSNAKTVIQYDFDECGCFEGPGNRYGE